MRHSDFKVWVPFSLFKQGLIVYNEKGMRKITKVSRWRLLMGKGKKEKKVVFFRKMSFRMILAFLVPVAFILVLGASSYQKASAQIIESYEKSTLGTMEMMNSYFALSVDMVQSTYKDYLTDETLVKYYKGVLNMDSSYAYIPRQFRIHWIMRWLQTV